MYNYDQNELDVNNEEHLIINYPNQQIRIIYLLFNLKIIQISILILFHLI